MFSLAHQIPSQYSILTGEARSVNGSSATGRCSSVGSGGFSLTCLDPTSSVLFDGSIPTLTGLDGDMWASQLLTIQSFSTSLLFDFSGTNFSGVRRVETIVFSCEEFRTSVLNIKLEANGEMAGNVSPTFTSCDSLVRLCIPTNVSSAQTQLILSFIPSAIANGWVHIAEMVLLVLSSLTSLQLPPYQQIPPQK